MQASGIKVNFRELQSIMIQTSKRAKYVGLDVVELDTVGKPLILWMSLIL